MSYRKVKIVATLGPATDTKEMIYRLAEEGVSVFRLNLSHRTKEKTARSIRLVRQVEKRMARPLGIIADLAGPKIRIGKVVPGSVLHAGRTVKLVRKLIEGSADALSLNFPAILNNLERGAEIYLADGLLKLEVVRSIAQGVLARVVIGGSLRSGMGFSAQGLSLAHFSLSAKDKEDIKTVSAAKVDAIAVSFVQTARDITKVKNVLPYNSEPMVIAKIETAAAVENSEQIIDAADGIMIARGDLGLSVPMPELPFIQKQLIRLALKKAKPVITATQMLESMIHNSLPTRAEVADVTKAILDGTDAVMLSGETAVGKFPEEVVRMMRKIIERASGQVVFREFPEEDLIADAISASTVKIARQINARLIIVFTESGTTARRIARHRPAQPIIALSPDLRVMRRLVFSGCVTPRYSKILKRFDEIVPIARHVAASNPIVTLKKGEAFIVSAGVPFGKAGSTNLVLAEKV